MNEERIFPAVSGIPFFGPISRYLVLSIKWSEWIRREQKSKGKANIKKRKYKTNLIVEEETTRNSEKKWNAKKKGYFEGASIEVLNYKVYLNIRY